MHCSDQRYDFLVPHNKLLTNMLTITYITISYIYHKCYTRILFMTITALPVCQSWNVPEYLSVRAGMYPSTCLTELDCTTVPVCQSWNVPQYLSVRAEMYPVPVCQSWKVPQYLSVMAGMYPSTCLSGQECAQYLSVRAGMYPSTCLSELECTPPSTCLSELVCTPVPVCQSWILYKTWPDSLQKLTDPYEQSLYLRLIEKKDCMAYSHL